MKKRLLFFLFGLLILLVNKSLAQTIVSAPYYDMTPWDSSPYKSFKVTGGNANPWYDMTFRLLWPKGYDSSLVSTTSYPLVVMFHGAGESALGNPQFGEYKDGNPKQFNNDHQLLHQGQAYLNAVNNGKWPGFVLFPQNPTGYWTGQDWYLAEAIEIIQALSQTLKIDPNRIHVSGLSAGSWGVWDGLARYTNIFASAIPMSGIGNANYDNTTRIAHIPLWYFQGGVDQSPSQWSADQTIAAMRNVGATPTYTVYPTLGHGTWNTAITEADYFPFFLRNTKLSIHAYFGKTEFCAGESVNVKLEISPGFSGYEWKKDDVIIPGATTNTITATSLGSYSVRFRRRSEWTAWSAPKILKIKAPTTTPVIAASGSTALPSLDGKNNVTLSAPAGYSSYKWSTGATTQSITVSNAGSYTVQVTEAGGCISNPSEAKVVTVGSGSNTPTPPSDIVVAASSPTILNISWSDNSSTESGFEIYKASVPAGPYTFLAFVGQNIATQTDINLSPNTTYYYKVRAINNNGPSAAASGSGITDQDIIAPTIPQNLTYIASTPSNIYLSWNASTDYVGVTGYNIYSNGVQVGSTPNTTFTVSSLLAGEIYNLVVKAKDNAGNLSASSNQVSAAAIHKGLKYSYYEGTWDNLPNFNSLTPVKTGYVSNFTLAPRNINDNFAFKFEGYIYIPTAGTYTFYSASDDGSKIYIGNTEVVNNDGLHGTSPEKTGTITLSVGAYPITVTQFEKTGGEALEVRYSGPGITKRLIPDGALVDTSLTLSLPLAPSSLTATVAAYNRINLTWVDNSSNETGFEIYRSSPNNTTYQILATVGAGTTSYSDLGLNGSTRYYYRVKAINDHGSSALSNEVNRTTSVSPNTPNAPSAPLATAVSSSSINIGWTDNSSNETAFEVQRSTTSNGTYTVVFTSTPNVTNYTDINLSTYTTYYYKIRSVNSGAYSAFTSVTSATTLTNPPSLLAVGNKTVSEGTSSDFTISATDPDNDVVTFSLSGHPSFIAITNTGGNNGKLTIAPGFTASGTYTTTILASDGKGGTSTETITITVTNVNRTPSLSAIGNQIVNEGSSLSINLSGSDPDNDALSFSVTSAPSFESFTSFTDDGNGTGTIVVTPATANIGTYSITVKVTDSNNAIASETFTLKVNKVNHNLPIIATIGNKTVNENTNQSYPITATDGDNDAISFGLSGNPAFVTLNNNGNNSGTLTVSPGYSHSGLYENIVITANDGNGGITTQTISVTVNDVNRAPIVAAILNQTVNEGTNTTINISATDPDNDVLTLSASNLPAGFSTFTSTNGTATLKLTPGFNHAGTYNNITITATDGKGGSNSKSFNLTVVDVLGGSQTPIYRVNCGGETINASPINWQTDNNISRSPYLVNAGNSSLTEGGCWWPDHTNTTGAPDCMFGTFRYDWGAPINYDFPVENGNYVVNLYFAQKKNTWPPDYQHVPGDHLFNVFLESELVLNNFDMFAENGFNAIKKSFNLSITDGHININFVNIKNSPQINGIEIISVIGAEPSSNARIAKASEEFEIVKNVKVLPNPVSSSSNKFTLVFNKALNETVSITILDEVGVTLVTRNYDVDNKSSLEVELPGASNKRGLYFVKVNSKTVKNQIVKLLKE